jgi:hypothetical protein
MGDSVFENCLNVSSLTFTNFNTFPTTEWGNDLFSGWKNNGEIRATGGMATSQNALDFAQNKGLPRSWTPIT